MSKTTKKNLKTKITQFCIQNTHTHLLVHTQHIASHQFSSHLPSYMPIHISLKMVFFFFVAVHCASGKYGNLHKKFFEIVL